jgi:uncharacterized protein (DUF3820 family)
MKARAAARRRGVGSTTFGEAFRQRQPELESTELQTITRRGSVPFGKFAGDEWSDVPAWYLTWCAGQDWQGRYRTMPEEAALELERRFATYNALDDDAREALVARWEAQHPECRRRGSAQRR